MTATINPLTDVELDEAMRIRRIAFQHFDAFALQEACEHGVFTALATQPSTPSDLATRLQLHPRGTRALLEALAAMRLLTVDNDVYRNAPCAEKFLVAASPFNQAEIIRHYREVIDFKRMRDSLTSGYQAPAVPTNAFDPTCPDVLTPAQRDRVQAMHDTAVVLAPALIPRMDLHGATRLLDVGGGSGSYSIFLALAHPQLQAVIFDSGFMVRGAQETASRYGLQDRISGHVADFHGDDYGEGYDAVLFSNVMHINSPEQCEHMFRRAYLALKPGGQVFVHEPLRAGHGDGPLFPALFSLSLMILTVDGDTYTVKDTRAWLQNAGFADIQHTSLDPLPTSLCSARRPACD